MKSIGAELLLQRMAPDEAGSLNRRLYDSLRGAILDSILPPGSQLPPSRDLARDLGLSRNTVLSAYEQLVAEGYLVSRVGSGTFVASTSPERFLTPRRAAIKTAPGIEEVRFARRAEPYTAAGIASPVQWGAFMPGVPDVTQLPARQFSRLLAKLWRSPSPELLTYGHGGGQPALRAAIAAHLRVARSVRCSPEQVLVTEGVHQAIDLCLRMLVERNDPVWVEEPGYWGFHRIVRMAEAEICPMSVESGAAWPSGKTPRLIFVTPSHQYPLGSVMSLAKRRELLELAKSSGAWIVEDDYDSEFRYSGRPIPAMQGLEDDARVIYIGTFSKTLFPGLRTAFMVLPPSLAPAFRNAHADLYREGHAITQLALAQLLEDGHYAAHIRRMRLVYGRRRGLLADLLRKHLGPAALGDHSSNAGLHLVLHLPEETDDVEIAAAAQRKGIFTRPLSLYYLGAPKRGLLLGYACVPDETLEPAFLKLLACLPRSLVRRPNKRHR